MNALNDAKVAKEITNKLMELNQSTFIRGKDMTPTGTKWTLDNQMEMFRLLMSLQGKLKSVEHRLSFL